MVRLESHFAEIIWYWDVADILYGVSDWRRACNCAESPVVFLHVGIEVGEVGDAKACHGLADVLLGSRVVRTDCHHWCGIIVQCCNSPVSSRTFFTEEQQGVASAFHAVYTFLETILSDKHTEGKYEQGVCVFRCLLLGIRDKSARYREPWRKVEPGNSMGHYNRFMVLLNQHCKVHHDVAFYACQLHITSQYLGRICRKYDGRGPKEIIDEMLLLQLKSTLKNTEKSMKEISYEYNFSNFSFMCSFFRRNVGISPSEFRAKYRDGGQV